jgi:PST family polysaccharide transporter
MAGGAALAARQGLGMGISLVTVLVLTRAAGPAAYGVFTAAMAVFGFTQALTQWGLGVYLVRQDGPERLEEFHQAATLLAGLGLVGLGAVAAAMPWLAAWTTLPGFGPVTLAVMATLPVALVTQVATARLERRLSYASCARIELQGQVMYLLVALPVAASGGGAWAFVAGYWVNVLQSAVATHLAAGYAPRPMWRPAIALEMVRYGLSYSASTWVWALRNLVNPMVVGRFAGAEAVGFVALAIRLVSILGFVKNAAWRLSIAALARLQHAPARMASAIAEGMRWQILGLGPVLAGFALVSPWLIPLVYGPSWAPVSAVFPWIALGSLGHAMFQLHFSALHVLRRNAAMAGFYALHVALFAGSAWLLVPRVGFVGYGMAEAIALPGYALVQALVARRVGAPALAPAFVWAAAWAVPLFFAHLGPWPWAALVVPLAWPVTRQDLGRPVAALRALWRPAPAAAEVASTPATPQAPS